MSPLDFLNWFRLELHRAGISFAITSGQACVYFGLQQTTKDSDWIEGSSARLKRGLLIERYLWQQVNHRRYFRYQSSWKEFFRLWRKEPGFQWPPNVSFAKQLEMLSNAAKEYALPPVVIADVIRREIISDAFDETCEIFQADAAEVQSVLPPIEVLLP
jgi:hypothetical protein